jgi:hypothetical protein
MKHLLSCLPVILACSACAQENDAWTAPLTPWGEPDLAGTWPIDHMNQTPVQRPASFGTRRFLTDEEYAQREAQLAAMASRYDEEDASDRMGMGHWVESGDPNRLTSLIFDPPNGRVPPMTDYGQAVSATMTSTWDDKPFYTLADFNPLERCITRGMPASMFPFMYNSGIQIVQSPGYVVINLELIHEARIIPTDGRAALAPEIKQWMGESRGRWEGNTLIVETTNFNAGSPMLIVGPGGGKVPTSEQLRIVERLTRVSDNEIDYEIHVEDPQVLTGTWTAGYPWRLNPDYEFFEYACHEDNVQLRYLLEHAQSL